MELSDWSPIPLYSWGVRTLRDSSQALWLFAHGVDDRPVDAFKGRRSIGAECNYGVRCETNEDADRLLLGLAAEVTSRLRAAGENVVVVEGGGGLCDTW